MGENHQRVVMALEAHEAACRRVEELRAEQRRAERLAQAEMLAAAKELRAAREEAGVDLQEARDLAETLCNTYDWTKHVEQPWCKELWEQHEGETYAAGIMVYMGGEAVARLYTVEGHQPEDLARAICGAGSALLSLASEVERLRGGGGRPLPPSEAIDAPS